MGNTEFKQSIYNLLKDMTGLDPLKQLFWSELNYGRINTPLPLHDWSDKAKSAIAEAPILFASHDNFHIIYTRLNSNKLLLGLERPIINRLIQDYNLALFIFSDLEQKNYHFVNVKYEHDTDIEKRAKRRIFRRITIGPNERLRTATERISMLDVASISSDLFRISALDVQKRHDEAFDVEQVTNEFFEDYKKLFAQIQKLLSEQTQDNQWAHDYSLLFLNRLMFLYFVQRKRWLGDDPDFIKNLWETYKGSGQPKDTFFRNWVEVMFFEAFNNKFVAGCSDRQHLPPKIRSAFVKAPYLNGGLFSQNQLDSEYEFNIPDAIFGMLFDRFNDRTPGFMESYNFTIREDSPFDQEVAVDPEMIGKVYESLINISTEGVEKEDHRGSAGIFYTPRVEIDMMCRLVLVDWLTNHLGSEYKRLIYEIVFAYEPEEQQEADAEFAKANLWGQLHDLLKDVTVLDPACGSGSFLVGMLMVLDGLQERAEKQLNIQEKPYERMKRIIGQNLYGVDVMTWAVHVAELRLWLQLIVETEIEWQEMKIKPLLPNLSFKIRPGDSLVQEVGGINFALYRQHLDISDRQLKGKITALKSKKLKFYESDKDSKLEEEFLKREEELLFHEILNTKIKEIKDSINKLTIQIESPPEQPEFIAIVKSEPDQLDLQAEEWKRKLELQQELAQVENAHSALTSTKVPPFIWDLAFVEIFEGDKKGFDIVIGNPPYVRQEKIAPPDKKEEDYTAEEWREIKKEYKEKLQNSIVCAYPRFHRVDNKSDLYIYFYLHGLSLLNDKGSFCFITSNSWLDVGYGKDLQEFLLKNCRIKMIIDNQAKRSFKQADVNTIIALISPPNPKAKNHENHAKFIMFKVPFEDILSPIIFEDIEETIERKTIPEGRIYPITQKALLDDGTEITEDDIGTSVKTVYVGNKWGGKYLRAPDIFYKILEKGKGKLVRLGDIADVRRGVTTGANEFFYLDQRKINEWGIEEEYLKPVIKSPRECKSILIDPKDLKFKILMCHEDKSDLKGTNVLEYIKWGEKQGFCDRPTCRSRKIWWNLGEPQANSLLWSRIHNDSHRIYICSVYAADTFSILYVKDKKKFDVISAILNSTLTWFMKEFYGRKSLGEGGLSSLGIDIVGIELINSNFVSDNLEDTFKNLKVRNIFDVFSELGFNQKLLIREQKPNPLLDRKALDDIIFDALGLNEEERKEVYWAVAELVKNRLSKANSLE